MGQFTSVDRVQTSSATDKSTSGNGATLLITDPFYRDAGATTSAFP